MGKNGNEGTGRDVVRIRVGVGVGRIRRGSIGRACYGGRMRH